MNFCKHNQREFSGNLSLIPQGGEHWFQGFYSQIICNDLILKSRYKTIHQLGKLEKVNINTTSKAYGIDKKNLLAPYFACQLITAQRPTLTFAKKSVASFHIREGQLLGIRVTLRKKLLYNFLGIFNAIFLARNRDFQGIHLRAPSFQKRLSSFEKRNGGFPISLSIKDVLSFPQLETHFPYFQKIQALNITYGVSKTPSSNSAILLSAFQFPIEPSLVKNPKERIRGSK